MVVEAVVLLLAFLTGDEVVVSVGIVVRLVTLVVVVVASVVVLEVRRLELLEVVLTGNVERITSSLTLRLVLLALIKSLSVVNSTRVVVVGGTLFERAVIIVIGTSVDTLLGRRVENKVVKNCGKNVVVVGKLVVVL